MRVFTLGDFDARSLADAKGAQRVSVCLPARDEAATIGSIVGSIHRHLVEEVPLVDEIIVVDDHSTDTTALIAESAGAQVIDASSVLTGHGEGHGKGAALWKSLHEATGDLIVWCDADIVAFDPRFVVGLLGPLVVHPRIDFVKGFYERPAQGAVGGGRVTELVARPLLAMFFPQLAGAVQPLAGECAGRRSVLEQLPFVVGYGVDVALLIDVSRARGVDAVAQIDLGIRHHRNRTLDELGPQALAVMQAILRRAGVDTAEATSLPHPGHDPVTIPFSERPPLVEIDGYEKSA